jgi:hypothetical protein
MSGQELLPITKEIYNQMVGIAWIMIGPMFLLSCAISYVREPGKFPAAEMVQRIVVTVALLSFFPEITAKVSEIANALADRIGEQHAIDALFLKIHDHANPQNQSSHIPFLINADIGVALLNYISFAVVYLAKYLMIALYHFFWSFMMALAPLAILCNLFRGTSQVTKNLFSSMIEISSWNIVWQILAVMLLGLNFVNPDPSNYFDAICFNFLLAIGMIGTPMLVHSFVRNGLSSPSAFAAGAGAVIGATLGPVGKSVGTAVKIASTAKNAGQRMQRSFNKGGSGERTT